MGDHEAFIDKDFVLHQQFAVLPNAVNRESQDRYDCGIISRKKHVLTFKRDKEDYDCCHYDRKKSNILHNIEQRIPF